MIFGVSRLHFYLSNKDIFGNLELTQILHIFKGGFRFDVVAIIYLNIIFILMYLLPGNFKNNKTYQKTADWVFVITNSLGLILNCIDSVYFQFNLKRSTYATFSEVSTMPNAVELFSGFMLRYWYVWAVWLLFLTTIVFLKNLIQPKVEVNKNHTQFDFFYISIFFIVAGVRGGDLRHASRPIGLNHAGEYVSNPSQIGLVLNTPFSIFKTLGDKKQDRLTYFTNDLELEKTFNPIQIVSDSSEFKPKNVIIFVIESYSEEASGYVNKDPKTGGFTPFLDSLRRHGVSSNITLANGKKSIEALPAILCGVPSLDETYILSQYSGNKVNSLPQILKERNYHTSFFHGAANGSMGFQAFCNLIGVDHYLGKDEFNNEAEYDGVWGIWDEPFLQFMEKKINTFPQPFMSTVFTLSSHDPFKVPEKHIGKFKKGPHPIYETLGYTDFAIKQFFEKAKNEPWFKNTIFVFTADHTSSHASLPEFSSSFGLFRVPIFLYSPTGDLPTKETQIIQQTDILPSVLSILNYNKPVFSFGKNIFNKNAISFGFNYFGAYQWIQDDYVLVFDGEKTSGFYNFAKDPQLKTNQIEKSLVIQTKMELETKAFLQQYRNRMIDNRLTTR